MSDFNVRRLTTDDLEQYNDLLRYAFQVTEKTLLESGWEDEDIRQSKFPVLENASVIGCFDRNDRLASQFAVFPIRMNIQGRISDIGFITSVATYPEYTGLGLMARLMRQSLTEMRNKGQTLAILYPYSIPLYRRRGFEIVSDKMSFVIKDTQLPKNLAASGYVRRVDEECPDLFAIHDAFAAQTHGCLLRNALAWEEYWRWDDDHTTVAVYYDAQHRPKGFMVYLLNDDVMHIKEIVSLDMDAWRGLWKYIYAHDSMVDEVRGANYSSETIAFWLEDSDIKETVRPYIMGRIIDVRAFIENYTFADPGRDETISLAVFDSFLEWNNIVFTLRFRNGKCEIMDGAETPPMALDIGALTTMLLGYKRPSTLARLERIAIEPDRLAILETVIPREKPCISDYI